MPRPPDLTPAEFNIMKVLWQRERATVAEVRAELNKKPDVELAYTTVMTLLGRLAAKGAVAVDKDREPYVYAPAFRRESVLRDRLRSFLSDVFDGDSQAMVLGAWGGAVVSRMLRARTSRPSCGRSSSTTLRRLPYTSSESLRAVGMGWTSSR